MKKNRPRRIAYVLKVFPKRSETFVAREIAEIKKRGISVCILSLNRPDELVLQDIVEKAHLEKEIVYGSAHFSEALANFKPDLIHAHFATEATAAAMPLALQYKCPLTFTAHGYDIYRRPPADFNQRAAKAAAVITVSEANRAYITQIFNVPDEKIRTISSGIDTHLFRPDKKPNPLPLIVCVARLVPVKNLSLLLSACMILKTQGIVFQCVIVGEGRSREDLETMQKQLQLEKTVVFTGAADSAQVLAWWQRADVAVLSSTSEGMPVSLLEAAACAVPIVATAVGGIPELVETGETGYLVPPGEASLLAICIKSLLLNPEKAHRMGNAARKKIEQRFSIAHQGDQLLALWTELINKEVCA